MSPSVEFFGETIRLAEQPNEYAMARFARIAGSKDANELAGLAAVMDLLEASIHPDDWARFDALAMKHGAQVERDLMPVVVALFSGEAARPTQQPSDSSAGLPSTAPKSTPDSSASSAGDRLRGRPDLMVIVEDSQRTA